MSKSKIQNIFDIWVFGFELTLIHLRFIAPRELCHLALIRLSRLG
jgi:hypothetical protein